MKYLAIVLLAVLGLVEAIVRLVIVSVLLIVMCGFFFPALMYAEMLDGDINALTRQMLDNFCFGVVNDLAKN